jgi:8-oxo-dGTP pyrophosphatase MutT (NUDIX family)
MNEDVFSVEEYRRRALRQAEPGVAVPWENHSDLLMNPHVPPILGAMELRDAAVLIPLIDDGDEPRIILTQRATTMRKHSGQIAFPGGGVDAEDTSPEMAAMREAEEEIGLARHFVEPLARLPEYSTMTGFKITPIIATVRPGFKIQPNPAEVEDVFDVPLSFLMNSDNHKPDSREFGGKRHYFYTMPYGERYIWGVTAGILRTLYERLYAW